MTDMINSEWANARIEKLEQAGTPFVVGEPCVKCGEQLYYTREGRTQNGCIRCHDDKPTNTILTPVEGEHTDGNGVKVKPRKRPKDGCGKCGSQWILIQNAYGQKAGYCHGCAVDALSEKEKTKAVRTFKTLVNRHLYNALHSSVRRSEVSEVLPRTLAEHYELVDLVERLTLMNAQEQMIKTGIRWELGHIYPAAGFGGDDPYRGVCRVENLSIIESRRNRDEGNGRPEEWTAAQIIPYTQFRAIRTSKEASEAIRTYKERVFGEMTPTQRASWEKKQREADDKHRELTKDLLSGEAHQLELLLNTILTPTFAQTLEEMSQRLEHLEYKTAKQIDGLIASGRAKESFIEHRDKLLRVSSFMGRDARLRVVVQTLQRIEDAHQNASELGDYEPEAWDGLLRGAVLWAHDMLSKVRTEIRGFTHPLLERFVGGELWGVKTTADGEQYLCIWEEWQPVDFPSETDNDARPFYSEHEQTWQQRVELLSVKGDGWHRCIDRFTYERNKEKAAREARQAERKAANDAKLQKAQLLLVERVAELEAVRENTRSKLDAVKAEAHAYYESEYTPQTPQSFFEAAFCNELSAYKLDEKTWQDAIDAAQEALSWTTPDGDTALRDAHKVCAMPTGAKHWFGELRLSEPFGGGRWLNRAEREAESRKAERWKAYADEGKEAKAQKQRLMEERQKKAAFMRSPEGQEWLRKRKAQ